MNSDLLAMRKKQVLKSLTNDKVSLPQENTHDYFCSWRGAGIGKTEEEREQKCILVKPTPSQKQRSELQPG